MKQIITIDVLGRMENDVNGKIRFLVKVGEIQTPVIVYEENVESVHKISYHFYEPSVNHLAETGVELDDKDLLIKYEAAIEEQLIELAKIEDEKLKIEKELEQNKVKSLPSQDEIKPINQNKINIWKYKWWLIIPVVIVLLVLYWEIVATILFGVFVIGGMILSIMSKSGSNSGGDQGSNVVDDILAENRYRMLGDWSDPARATRDAVKRDTASREKAERNKGKTVIFK